MKYSHHFRRIDVCRTGHIDVAVIDHTRGRYCCPSIHVKGVTERISNRRAWTKVKHACRVSQDVDTCICAIERGGPVKVVDSVGISELQTGTVGCAKNASVEGQRSSVILNPQERAIVGLRHVAAVGY